MVLQFIRSLIRTITELRTENAQLREENARLRQLAPARRTMKARSPADWRFRVIRWEMSEQTIYPRDLPAGKVVPNLRVYIHPDDPNEGAPYWDITSKRVIAMLEGLLPHIAGTGAYVRIRKDGDGRTSQFSISVEQPKP